MKFSVPLFDLNYTEDEERAVLETIRSKWISSGPKTIELEDKFAKMLDAEYAVAVTNSTAALHLAMVLNGVGKGDEVICPSLTFVATANAVRYVGANPVFADIVGYEDLTIDPEDIERRITSKTKAIMVMHYGGNACDMERIMDLAKRHDLRVIEDACHAPLSEYKGSKLGTFGDVGTFSFFSNKNISTGEGGMLVTNSEENYKKAKLLRSHGMTTMSFERAKGHSASYDVVELGYNYRIDDLRASLAIVQLDKLKDDLEKREKVRRQYFLELDNNDDIYIPFRSREEFSSNYIFPIVLKNSTCEKRNNVRDKLAEYGIQTSVHYPAVHRFSIYENYFTDLPKTDYVSENLITLPMYSNLTQEQVRYVVRSLNEILKKY